MDDITASPVIVGAELRQIVERIERLEEEKRQLATDIKEVFAEAKVVGLIQKFCVHASNTGPKTQTSVLKSGSFWTFTLKHWAICEFWHVSSLFL